MVFLKNRFQRGECVPTLNKAFRNIGKHQGTRVYSRASSHCRSRGCSSSNTNLCISDPSSFAKATSDARYWTPGQPANPVAQPVTQPTILVVQEGPAAQTRHQNNYLSWSICNTLFCCLPLGIIAIIFSVMCRDAAGSGRREQVRSNAIAALVLNILSTLIGVPAYITYVWLISQLF